MGLIDDQHRLAPLRMQRQQEDVERVDVVLDRPGTGVGGRHLDAELIADGLQQLKRREFRVEDIGDLHGVGHLLQEAAEDGGLAGTDIAGEQDNAATALQSVQQVGQCLAMARTHEEVARVRSDRKWVVLKAKVAGVHASSIPVRGQAGGVEGRSPAG